LSALFNKRNNNNVIIIMSTASLKEIGLEHHLNMAYVLAVFNVKY